MTPPRTVRCYAADGTEVGSVAVRHASTEAAYAAARLARDVWRGAEPTEVEDAIAAGEAEDDGDA